MYDLDAVRRKVRKEGVDKTISDLTSENFSDEAKESLSHFGVFLDGYPNLSLIYSLA